MAFGFLKKLRGNKDKPKEEAAAPTPEVLEAAVEEIAAMAATATAVIEETGSAVDAPDAVVGDADSHVSAEAAAVENHETHEEGGEVEETGEVEGAHNISIDSHNYIPASQVLDESNVNLTPPVDGEAIQLSRTGSVASMPSSRGVPPSNTSRKGPRKAPPSSVAGSTRSKGPAKYMKKVPKAPPKSPPKKSKVPPPSSPPVTRQRSSNHNSADEATQEITPSPARGGDIPPGAPDGPTSMHMTEEDTTAAKKGPNVFTASSDDESDGPTFEAVSPTPPKAIPTPKPSSPKQPIIATPRPQSPPRQEVKPKVEVPKYVAPPIQEEEDYEYEEEEEQDFHPPAPAPIERNGSGSKVAKLVVAERFLGLLAPRQFGGKVLKLKNVTVLDDRLEEEVTNKTVWLQRDGNKRLLYDEVQMVPSDVGTVDSTGLAETSMTMVVVDGHEKGFVETEREAIRLLATEGSLSSVYVIEKQAVMARESAIRAVASLVVVWRPHSSPSEEYNCAVHHKPMELYDPITRDVACALCSAVEGRKMLVLSEVVSPHLQAEVQKVLTAKHEGTLGALRKQAGQHQRLSRAQSRAVEQINGQFDAIVAAIEAKRQEVLDDLYTETSSDIRDLSDGIASNLQTMQLLNAAHSSLRTADPLLPPQLATIATALKAPSATPATNSKPKKVALNLEGVMNELNAIAYCIAADDRLPLEQPPRGRSAGASPRRTASPQAQKRPVSAKVVQEDTVSLAASQPGTSLFNFSLQEELEGSRGLEWKLRIEDSGDWLGVGVGVGGTLESWAEGSVFDLHHLWVVPQGSPRLLIVRLSRMGNVNVKLSIHDRTGRQLDDGRIPHWNVKRSCYPQVSFGGRHGRVVMVSAPTRL